MKLIMYELTMQPKIRKFANMLYLIVIIGFIIFSMGANGISEDMNTQQKMVIEFSTPEEIDQWRVVNDGVMGGLSKSQINKTQDNTAVFQGTISLENYGGFASVRTRPRTYNLTDYTGLIIRVKGDGKRYQFRVRTDDQSDGIGYRSHFTTKVDTWITVRVPFSEFVPTFRGRVLTDAPPLAPDQIRQIGFLIADKQEGSFRLEIDWIQAYKTK
jgi:monofunctional biosynthetic peptidoglycan transglycosylase